MGPFLDPRLEFGQLVAYFWVLHLDLEGVVIIDREALAKQGDNALGSVGLSVRLCVCLSAFSRLNRLTFDLDFWYGGRA